jgi:hypothetical protein
MLFEISEREIIYILNCINFSMENIHNTDLSKLYFKKDNFWLYFQDMRELHRRMSLTANEEIYNMYNETFFVGQRDYLISKEKDFEFLKGKHNNQNKKLFLNILYKRIDKIKNIV